MDNVFYSCLEAPQIDFSQGVIYSPSRPFLKSKEIRRCYFEEHTLSYEKALEEFTRRRWFTVRNVFKVTEPGKELYYRYSAVGKRGST
jgi:hypothetical protein